MACSRPPRRCSTNWRLPARPCRSSGRSATSSRSGTLNAGAPLRLRATATAEASTYAGIVRLVEAAQAEKAPFVRLANRYSMIFLPASLALAGLAWLASGDAIRALAVLIVATPCPLILAAPVAIMAGISAAAKRGILVKGGGALETLARVRTLVFDKTGTLTTGQARIAAIESYGALGETALLRLAASLDQFSTHPIAAALRRAAERRSLELAMAEAVEELPGAGIAGRWRAMTSGSVASASPVAATARRPPPGPFAGRRATARPPSFSASTAPSPAP